jgi:tRNA(Ile2) C34 agmatinyltransferase TiaS
MISQSRYLELVVEAGSLEALTAAFQANERNGFDTVCPDCRTSMIRLGICFSCPLCGFGSCG